MMRTALTGLALLTVAAGVAHADREAAARLMAGRFVVALSHGDTAAMTAAWKAPLRVTSELGDEDCAAAFTVGPVRRGRLPALAACLVARHPDLAHARMTVTSRGARTVVRLDGPIEGLELGLINDARGLYVTRVSLLGADLLRGGVVVAPPPPPGTRPLPVLEIPEAELLDLRIAGSLDVSPSDEAIAGWRQAGLTSLTARFKVCLDEQGSVLAVRVIGDGAGDPLLNVEILGALLEWRFRPYAPRGVATAGCGPVSVFLRVPS